MVAVMAGDGVGVDAGGLEDFGAAIPDCDSVGGALGTWTGETREAPVGGEADGVTVDRGCDLVQPANASKTIAPAMRGRIRTWRPRVRHLTRNPGVRIDPLCTSDLTNP